MVYIFTMGKYAEQGIHDVDQFSKRPLPVTPQTQTLILELPVQISAYYCIYIFRFLYYIDFMFENSLPVYLEFGTKFKSNF